MHTTVAEIANLIGGQIVGDGNVKIQACAGIHEAKNGHLTFIISEKYLPQALKTEASAVIIPRQMSLPGKTVIRVDNPSLAFTLVLKDFLKDIPSSHPVGIHPTAVIDPSARIGRDVAMGPYVVIDKGAVIGDRTILYAHSYIGPRTHVGADCLFYAHVNIREDIHIGNRVIIQQGAVIGSDGYGYVMMDGRHEKIPQIGTVVIEDDVEIGANAAIDRARFEKTIIGEGTKIDNLVHIAHNVITGKHCLIIAQAGVSGSARLGNYVILAGQVGVVGHLTIGDGAIVTAQSGVSKSIKAGEQVFGSPAQPIKQAFITNAHIQRLDHYAKTIKELKQRVDALEKR